MAQQIQLMDGLQVNRSLTRIAHEILERNRTLSQLVLAGILTRGWVLADRLADKLAEIEKEQRPHAFALDVRPFRDDLEHLSFQQATLHSTPETVIQDKKVVLVDDVLFTGRTVRAALDALMTKGRAQQVQLAVLVDRGHRELPIRPDFVGKNLPTSLDERISVKLQEVDGEDGIWLAKP
ncbi:bifunctional pyr operon transcriptional regulator/uracil phosphoribosyltransferase PyrR [Alicyclobacillus tolerans]|uniref:Bifunctional protein PyrR n=2 Tax=Alicyclobacillus tolerans TaxID=90970 RepID=A0ABT9LVW9_9BACL|nr:MULTISPECIES: bifunctional pyr operon transcriptional regulator/uracil phosphoribosyltransferase PyrR [Alicyclobacillus]MDP9728414.1 pyrimidine operon attenuation protein/uracil phosphoribosyltransferase [Alicyclobacillus tengchongensis]QRF23794.1 bifunctional pyr operon transcriptional regulator/uracil phosphoribosyltransferase PyrR [Alicyclobacillus sp. TC]SHK15796.1 pyrimidine operon attenuation protein / uracil phosphoribosyltransferase [Alicyclobacillus montanus]